jgi:hypothetical protein
MLQKNLSKNPFYEKVKMFKTGLFVVESFVNVDSFDYDCTQICLVFHIHVFCTSFQTFGVQLNIFL